MGFIRRNIAFIVLSISSLVIASSFAYALFKRDSATFYLKDITGNRSALRGITITGVLQDRFHGWYFQISNGGVQHRFKYYQKAADMVEPEIGYLNGITYNKLVYSLSYGFKIPSDATIEVESTPLDTSYGDLYGNSMVTRTIIPSKIEVIAHIDIKDKQFRFFPGPHTFQIPTGVFRKNDDALFTRKEIVQKYSDGNLGEAVISRTTGYYSAGVPKPYYDSLKNCMTFLDGKLYFTLPTTKEYSGENGIFVVDEFGFPLDQDKIGKGRKIAKWSLNDHNMDVLGLKSLNHRLVLITAINNTLSLRLYDKQGTILDQVAFENITLDISSTVGADANSQNFEFYTNDDILNIRIFSPTSNKQDIVISAKIGDKIMPLHTIKGLDFGDDEIAQYYDIHTEGDKIYIVANLKRVGESPISESHPLMPTHFIIMVYQNSNLMYKGELITDADEDFEMDRLRGQTTSNSRFDPFMYRQFYGIELR